MVSAFYASFDSYKSHLRIWFPEHSQKFRCCLWRSILSGLKTMAWEFNCNGFRLWFRISFCSSILRVRLFRSGVAHVIEIRMHPSGPFPAWFSDLSSSAHVASSASAI